MEQIRDISILDESIRQRLATLLKEHSQAEVARRAGTSKSNVSRYMRGGKIPAEFCAGLVTGLGINPGWLLSGEGTPWLADVSADTASTASGLLDMVQAMSAVTRLRLGALTGKEQARVLRELDDALSEFENLKNSLNERTRPFFDQILADLSRAIDERDKERAISLRAAATQLSRLSHDPAREFTLANCQARLEYLLENFAGSLDHQRKVFYGVLANSPDPWNAVCGVAGEYIHALNGYGCNREARRIARGTLRLAAPGQHATAAYGRIRAWAAILDVELGDVERGLMELERLIGRRGGKAGETGNALGFLAYARVLAGSLSLASALASAERDYSQSFLLVMLASWTEDLDLAKSALKVCVGSAPHQLRPDRDGDSDVIAGLDGMIRVLDRGERGVLDAGIAMNQRHLRAQHRYGPIDAFSSHAGIAQIARLLGERELGIEHVRHADEWLTRHEVNGILPGLLVRALHYRNALGLIDPAQDARPRAKAADAAIRSRAAHFFREHFERGYGLFRGVVAELGK